MIRKCTDSDVETIYGIINDASTAYKGHIPADRWKEPYMSLEELRHEISEGVDFYCFEEEDEILGVMGIQDVSDVKLVRHAYVRTSKRKTGIGTQLLHYLTDNESKPILIGTWKDAVWAVDFYLKNGFRQVSEEEKNVLLKKYWNIPDRQVETSIVLTNSPEKLSSGEDIEATIIALEKQALELWNNGDPDGFLELSSDDVIYFDPVFEEKFEGKKALEEYYNGFRGKNKIDSYEMIRPVIQLTPECAVLAYDYEARREGQIYRMHCTEVYKLDSSGQWKIIHTHWSFVFSNK